MRWVVSVMVVAVEMSWTAALNSQNQSTWHPGVTGCGQHEVRLGQVITITPPQHTCTWTFKGANERTVAATCERVRVAKTKECQALALVVSANDKNAVRFCGRRARLVINRGSNQLTLSSFISSALPSGHLRRTSFSCDIYLAPSADDSFACSVGQYPWVGGVAYGGMRRVFCGVTVISNIHVLTAAHCIDGKTLSKLTVVLAEHDLMTTGESLRTIRNIAHVAFAPNHRYMTVGVGDLAVITLDHPLPLHHPQIRPVCLPESAGETYVGMEATVLGWGTTSPSSTRLSNTLQAGRVRVLSNKACRSTTGYGTTINPSLLCAGRRKGGVDACKGDSGGPLTVQGNDSRHILIGIVSYGRSCARPYWPGVYTRISAYLDWIQKEIQSGICCTL